MRPFLNRQLVPFLPNTHFSCLNKRLLAVAEDTKRIEEALQTNPKIQIEDLILPIKPKTSIIEFFATQLENFFSSKTK